MFEDKLSIEELKNLLIVAAGKNITKFVLNLIYSTNLEVFVNIVVNMFNLIQKNIKIMSSLPGGEV